MSTTISSLGSVRRSAFYAAVLLAIAVPVFMTGEMLLWLATGWSWSSSVLTRSTTS